MTKRRPLMPPERTCTGWTWLCPACNRLYEAYVSRWGAYLAQLWPLHRHHRRTR